MAVGNKHIASGKPTGGGNVGRKNRRNPKYRHVYRDNGGVGGSRTETRRGVAFNVKDISTGRAQKVYRCPGCPNDIPIGQAHLVVWSAEDFFGDASAVAGRRHWHTHCWRIS